MTTEATMRKTKSTTRLLHKLLKNAPIVRKLSGILSQNVSVADYKKYLEEKYGSKR